MAAEIAFYKGPPTGLLNKLGHYAIRLWTWSKWGHAELVIDGVCWSASARDGGVRQKHIDLNSGRWDLVSIPLSDEEVSRAHAWFLKHEGDGYDYLNIARFVMPPLGHERDKWVCFEAIGAALGLAAPHKLTAKDLWQWAAVKSDNSPKGNQHGDD